VVGLVAVAVVAVTVVGVAVAVGVGVGVAVVLTGVGVAVALGVVVVGDGDDRPWVVGPSVVMALTVAVGALCGSPPQPVSSSSPVVEMAASTRVSRMVNVLPCPV
jgi:hypothetical protein